MMTWFVKGLEYSAKSPGNTVFKEQVLGDVYPWGAS